MYTNPFFGFLRTLMLFASRRVFFNKNVVGNIIVLNNKETYTVFRRVTIKGRHGSNHKPEALFIVRFLPKTEIAKNIKLSKFLLLIFMGFKGFRSKYWCVDENSGKCAGIYEWDTIQDAKRYSESIAIRNMTSRSTPGTVSYEILPNTEANRNWIIKKTTPELKNNFIQQYHPI